MSLSDNDEPVHADSDSGNSLQTTLTRRSISQAAPPPEASSAPAPPAESQEHTATPKKKRLAGFDDIRASLERLQHSVRRSGGIKKLDKTRTLNPRGGDVIKVLSDQCEQAFAQIAKKEEDLKLAAEIGQHLLNKVDQNFQAASVLEEKLVLSAAQMEKLKEEKRQVERQEKRLRMMLEDMETANKRLEQQIAAGREALERAKGRRDDKDEELMNELENQIKELTAANSKLYADNEKLSSELKLERENYEFLQTESEQNRTKLSQLANLEATIANLRKKIQTYEKKLQDYHDLEWEYKRVHATNRELSAVYNRMQEQQAEDQARLDELQRELEYYRQNDPDAVSPLRSPRSRVSGLGSPRSLADELIAEETDAGSMPAGKDRRQYLGNLETDIDAPPVGSRRRSNTTPYGDSGSALMEEKDSESFGGQFADEDERDGSGPGRTYGRGGGAGGSSMANSGEDSVSGSAGFAPTSDHPLADISGQGDVMKAPNSYDEQGRKYHDANKEFFFLTALAIKLNTGDIMEHIQTVSTKQLWEKAQTTQIPFHQYSHFIEREITHAYIERIYSGDDSVSSNERSEAQSRRSTISRQQSGPHVRTSSSVISFAQNKQAGANLAASKSARYLPKFVKNIRKATMQ